MPKKVIMDRSVLEHLYVEEGKFPSEIGKMLGCSKATVLNYIKRYGISRPAIAGNGRVTLSARALREAYVYRGMTMGEIAAMFSCSESTVSAYIKRWGIKKERDAVKADVISDLIFEGEDLAKIARMTGMGKTQVTYCAKAMGLKTKRQLAHAAFDAEKAIEMYVNQKMSLLQIARHFDVSKSMVRDTLIRNGIERRPFRQGKRKRGDHDAQGSAPHTPCETEETR